MALGYVRMWRCAAVFTLILLAAFFAGANAHFTSGEDETKIVTRRLLGVHVNDYGEPSANQGHDPRGKGRKPPKKRHS
ncbi:putative protein PSY [Helianthus annuus]|uniref:Transmembrane protein n=1 Tax=Helianthus annuus TaxID=4232 RepID=A0A251VMY2_HELAN|nr:putative protein PSY [Helianthus annuus]KAJ0622305.1 putative protein PSY [Helianthus annuus]KAJ0956547.1 putative protein PSY [Helianthus annuus]